MELGKYQEALNAYDKALKIAPQATDIRRNRLICQEQWVSKLEN